ncbi:hypothetical protein BMS3Abin06_00621 [bacterium BMS3Abin06]|nr:hypothetical protein BMS3Abin06_00621 [bacterium BMS3Abin06]
MKLLKRIVMISDDLRKQLIDFAKSGTGRSFISQKIPPGSIESKVDS